MRSFAHFLISPVVAVLVAWHPVAAIGDDSAPPDGESNAAAIERPAPSAEQIADWIAQLDDNRYVVRERATRQLLESEAAALDPLLATANAKQPEPADRAVWILRRLGDSKDMLLRRQALERLVQLQNRPQAAAAAHEALAEIRHSEAVAAIQRLGGRFVAGEQFGPYVVMRVELDHEWRGGDAGMVHFRGLMAASQVIIIGADVSAKGAAELQYVNQLKQVYLYRTKVTPEDLPALKKVLPHVELDFRRGGLLGVGANSLDGMGAAIVGTVQPGSAAEEAGIQVGDMIMKFQNQPVPNFKTLTNMIGEHVGGDEVTLEVLRGGQPIHFKLKLGEWKSLP